MENKTTFSILWDVEWSEEMWLCGKINIYILKYFIYLKRENFTNYLQVLMQISNIQAIWYMTSVKSKSNPSLRTTDLEHANIS